MLGGCSTSKQSIPGLTGPSELGLAITLTATPDILTADGVSKAVVQAVVHDQNGHLKAGQPIFFSVSDQSGNLITPVFADIGGLNTSSAVSGPDGTAQVIYTAPYRTDFTGNGKVLVTARPISGDANGQIYRTTTVELHTAEGRLFPPRSGNKAPNCDFAVQAPFGFLVGQSILFQTTASDPDGFIVRYFWTFGDDGAPSDKPDVEHHYNVAGDYSVTQIVTDNNGAQAECDKKVTIN
jgi:PKD repeat protein